MLNSVFVSAFFLLYTSVSVCIFARQNQSIYLAQMQSLVNKTEVVSQPNILWLSCEDMSAHLGAYGDSVVPTPNIDKLAREGIRYTNAFSCAGVCAPSRSGIITGMYPTTIGTHNMRTLSIPNLPDLPAYSAVLPSEIKAFPEFLRAEGYYCTNNSKTDYQFEPPPTTWDDNSNKAHWRNRKPGQPFFAVFNSMVTHESQVWMRKDKPLVVDPSKVPLPPYYPDSPIIRTDVARHYSNIAEMDRELGEILEQLEADGLLNQTIIFFWSDHGDGLPRAKRELYDSGIKVPLIIRYPDKRMAGSVNDQLVSLIDLAPTVLFLAGIQVPAYMQGQAFAGQQQAKNPRQYIFAARDRMDSEYDRVRAVRDKQFKYLKNYQPEKPFYQNIQYRLQMDLMQELLRWKEAGKLNEIQQLWFRPTKPVEELYDLSKDPLELNNLAMNPQYKKDLQRLRAVHEKWMTQTKDVGALPEKELVKQMWGGKDSPPLTAAPEFRRIDNTLAILCATPGASIGYQILENGQVQTQQWQVYTKPVPLTAGVTIQAIAMRIGYKASETQQFTFKGDR